MKFIRIRHLVILVVLIILLLAMLLIRERFSSPSTRETSMVPSAQVTSDIEPIVSELGQAQRQLESKSFIIRPGQSRLSYVEALDLYKNNILQFDENCQVTSGNKSFGLNNEIMIDNRSSKANTFVVGDTLVAIAPYDFAFLILREKGSAVPVNCGNSKNVTTLNVQ